MKEQYCGLAKTAKDKQEAIERLAEIIGILRKECPWDKVQTHESLRLGMLEEAYEVVEAINNRDLENLREELGDVLLQVVFHAHIEEENQNFDLTDVINEECAILMFFWKKAKIITQNLLTKCLKNGKISRYKRRARAT